MEHDSLIKLNHQISEEAASWFIEFRTGDVDAEARRAFDAWVRASPEHLRAFIEIAALWGETGTLGADLSIEDLMARAEAESNIVPLGHDVRSGPPSAADAVSPAPPELRKRRSRRIIKLSLAAAIIVGLVTATLLSWSQLHGLRTYTTEVGEQRSIRLGDGSTVMLNSRSRLRVAFTETERAVELLQGQALFHVAKDSVKPFVVHSDRTLVRAVGTQFDVNRSPSGIVVTVVEGRVAVYSNPDVPLAQASGSSENFASSGSGPSVSHEGSGRAASHRSRQPTGGDESDEGAVLLSAGEQIRVIEGHGSSEPVRANVSSATAWTQGQLVLESASLAEVADQFNRYSSRKLLTEDHGATLLRLSGVFSTDPDFLIRYLRERPDIVIHESNTEIDIVRKAPE